MAEIRPIARPVTGASYVLGRKMDSIPFSGYQVLIIAVLALVGFIEGYDLVMTGSLLVLAKAPLHLTDTDINLLIFSPPLTLTIGGFFFSALSDHVSRKLIVLIGVILTTRLEPTDCRSANAGIGATSLLASVSANDRISPRPLSLRDGNRSSSPFRTYHRAGRWLWFLRPL